MGRIKQTGRCLNYLSNFVDLFDFYIVRISNSQQYGKNLKPESCMIKDPELLKWHIS